MPPQPGCSLASRPTSTRRHSGYMSNADVAKRNVRRREFEVLRRQNSGLGDVLQRASVDELLHSRWAQRQPRRGPRVKERSSCYVPQQLALTTDMTRCLLAWRQDWGRLVVVNCGAGARQGSAGVSLSHREAVRPAAASHSVLNTWHWAQMVYSHS